MPRSRAPIGVSALLGACAVAAQGQPLWNTTTDEPLRPGVYGRVEVRGAVPPAVVYQVPVVVEGPRLRLRTTKAPVFLYVPPGQVRRWPQSCARWKACDQPVLFVRVDDSPSRWGQWRRLRDEVAFSPQP